MKKDNEQKLIDKRNIEPCIGLLDNILGFKKETGPQASMIKAATNTTRILMIPQ